MSARIAFIGLSLLFVCVAANPLIGPLPTPTSLYTAYVSAGFGDLLFSLHYQEFGNLTGQIAAITGRYYHPLAQEWINQAANRYELVFNGCSYYYINEVINTRFVLPAAFLLTGLQADNLNFTNLGLTQSIRSQNSVHYTLHLQWSTGSGSPPPSSTLEQLLLQAYILANVDTSGVYAFSLDLDVYFSADSRGNLLLAQGGAMPLRFTVTGTSNNGVQLRNVNIVFDFSQWAALDSASYSNLGDPAQSLTCSQAFGLPPALPYGSLLDPTEGPPQWVGSGESSIELTASNAPTLQVYALQDLQFGQERLDYLVDPDQNNWQTQLYQYYFNDERDFRFQNGALYTINNSYSSANIGDGFPQCSGGAITASTVNPLQWTDAANLNTLFADGAIYFKGATFAGRQSIRGITTDSWSINKHIIYLGTVYDYTVTVFAEAIGWANLGRTALNLTPEIVRIYYNGTSTLLNGLKVNYWLQLDFFLQYFGTFVDGAFRPDSQTYGFCQPVPTNGSILPTLPAQYSVTVNAAFTSYLYSSQYTEYVDTTRNLRRVDGRFAPPNTFTLTTGTVNTPGQVELQEWTQDVSLLAGFSAYSVNNSLPYTQYHKDSGHSAMCAISSVGSALFNSEGNINFFDFLAKADPSEAAYLGTYSHRGVDCDKYHVSYSVGRLITTVYDFTIFYLSGDETTTATIPLTAEMSIGLSGTIFQWPRHYWFEFYNFRAQVPPGVFNAPPAASCSNNLVLPGKTPSWFFRQAPDASSDSPPTKVPLRPSTFSMLIEGQFFIESGDYNVYTARWYADFDHFRERLDIEPSYDIAGVGGVTPVQGSFIYYYNHNSAAKVGQFAFNDGLTVSYDGKSCKANAIDASSTNPLKRVAPGNLFDSFFPATTASVSAATSYIDRGSEEGFYYDRYDWNVLNTNFSGVLYSVTNTMLISIPEWVNNPGAVNFNSTSIPLGLKSQGSSIDQSGASLAYFRDFELSHFVSSFPGIAFFDAKILGCATTPSSPWYNISGNEVAPAVVPSNSSDSASTAVIVGVVVGCGVGIVLLVSIAVLCWKKRLWPSSTKYAGGTRGHRDSGDNELAGVGKKDEPENSLNRASLNTAEVSQLHLVMEGGIDVEDNTTANTGRIQGQQ